MILNQYYRELSGLRGVAVLLVILNHAIPASFSGGYIGVDVFFVLSGFLITRLIINDIQVGRFKFKDFYIRRVRRIYPAVLCTVIVTLLIGFLLYSPFLLKDLAESSIYTVFSISNIYFWHDSDYFSSIRQFKPLLHTWSLSVEEQFYLFWPLIIVVLSIKRLIFRGIFLFALLSLALSQFLLYSDILASFYLMPSRVFEFAIGALAIPLISYLKNSKKQLFGVVEIGLTVVIMSAIFFTEETLFPGTYALIPVFGTLLIIVGVSVKSFSLVGRFLLTNRLLDNVGKISYSLYLVHWPVLVYFQHWLWEFRDLNTSELIIYLIVCLLLAWMMYHFVEKRWRIGREISPSYSVPIRQVLLNKVTAAILLITCGCLMTQNMKGFPERLVLPDQKAYQKALELTLKDDFEIKFVEGFIGRRHLGVEKPKADILILGDSHATQHRHHLSQIATQKNLKVELWAIGVCPALFGVKAIYTKEGLTTPTSLQRECHKASGLWEEYIKTPESPSVVWLMSRWHVYYEHLKHGNTRTEKHYLLGFGNEKTMNAPISREVFEKAIRYTVKQLTDAGKKVIIVSQVPNIGMRSLAQCANTPRYLFTKSRFNDRCLPVTKRYILSRSAFTDGVFRTVASEFENVEAVIPTEYFCPEEKDACTVFDQNGIALWHDHNHLNITGSKLMLDHYADVFFKD